MEFYHIARLFLLHDARAYSHVCEANGQFSGSTGLQEEQEYVELVAAEKHQQEAVKSALAQNKTLSMLDEILEDVRKAADRLEEEIEEHAFDNNKQVSSNASIPTSL